MTELGRYFQSFIIPILVPVLVGMGASGITSAVMVGRLDERLSSVEKMQERHEAIFTTLQNATGGHERRISTMEAGFR